MKRMQNDQDMLEECDFSGGLRGKYSERYAEGTNVVVVDPEVAEFFPDQQSVNDALRHLAAAIKSQRQGERRAEHRHAADPRSPGG